MSRTEPDPTAPDKQIRIPDLPEYHFRLPDPTGRKDKEYYRNPVKRGYLVHTVKAGEGPSLYFKPPAAGVQRERRVIPSNKLWNLR